MFIDLFAALLCAATGPAPGLPPKDPPATQAQRLAKMRRGKPPMTGVLNVNRATEAELRLLPGIGKRKAGLIVERRTKRPFANLDDLARVKGMRNLVRKLHSRLCVQGDTTLRPLTGKGEER